MRALGSSLLRASVSRSRISVVVSQALVLYLLGLLAYSFVQARLWVEHLHENVEIQVFLKPEVPAGQVKALMDSVGLLPEVKDCRYVGKETAARELSKELGEDFVDFLGENPLLASLKIRLHYNDGKELPYRSLVRRLEARTQVAEVVYPRRLMAALQRNFRTVGWILLALSGFLLGITWLLIDQAVRLAMFADRHLIRSMQLVGADDGFIRKPYLRQALMASVLALCGAGVLLAVTVFWVLDWAPDLHHPDSVVYLPWMGALWASFALLGGWLSHFAALNKYLRLDTDQLHA